MLLSASGGGAGGRDVIFRLVAQADPAAKQVLKQWGDALAAAQKQATAAATQEVKKQADDRLKSAKTNALDVSKVYQKAEMEDFKFRQKLTRQHFDEQKKAETEFAQWRQRLRANSAQLEQKENVRLIRERQRAEEQAARDSAREQARAARETAMQHRQAMRRERRMEHAAEGLVGGLGNLARGAAYSGLIGEQNSQTILNTVLGVEAAGSAYRGGKSFVGSMGTLASGGTATGRAALAAGAGPSAAAAAALIAWLPALASAVRGAAITIKGSDITRRGNIGGGFGEGIARTYSGALSIFSTKDLQMTADYSAGGYMTPYAQAELSGRALKGQSAASETRRIALAQQAAALGQIGQLEKSRFLKNRGSAGAAMERSRVSAAGLLEAGNIDLLNRPQVRNPDGSVSTVRSMGVNIDDQEVLLPTVVGGRVVSEGEAIQHYRKTGQHLGKFSTPEQSTAYAELLHEQQERFYGAGTGALQTAADRFSQVSKGGMANEAVQQAAENVRGIYEQIQAISLKTAHAQIEGSRDQLSNLRQAHSETKQMADQAKQFYESDILRAGASSPEEIARLRTIARKRASGEGLTAKELETAAQFHEFRDLTTSESERRAREFGLSDIFAGGRSAAGEAARKQTDLAAQIAEVELTVKQQHEVIVRIEGGGFTEEAFEKIREQLEEFEDKQQRDLEDKLRGAQVQFANARSPTR